MATTWDHWFYNSFFSTGIYFLKDDKQKVYIKGEYEYKELNRTLDIYFGTIVIIIKRRLNIKSITQGKP